ncbi:type III-A CRISPR-associated RAMP protein Csm5 [Candidatus Cetobacterium colombiensis]|uniref:CRISPR system Cms protein Csm2 n=1 Tax=Candidatus Cetobacterium colombiensis TaxID=3073100 RepID=A0ABU4WCG8_9FUSO|nr:type III-A CRISPR-associated RAMP protein Csm5 [Candidatus Cetobacterium colombiensis]MDX8337232.1 type III-A CRISPR-associated RAMP protein Csm5 [Candidatus Cetobacterium colombiensis]
MFNSKGNGGYNGNRGNSFNQKVEFDFEKKGYLKDGIIREELITEEAEKIAKEFNNNRLSTSQLRAFFNEVKAIKNRVKDDGSNYNMVFPLILMLKSKAEYKGSSIKGAIRTAFLSEEGDNINYKLGRKKDSKTAPFVLLDNSGKFSITNKKQVTDKVKEIEAGILNIKRLDPKADPFKNISVGDTSVVEDAIKVFSIERVSKNPEKNSMPMGTIEGVKSLLSCGKEISFTFRMSFKNYRDGTFKGRVRDIIEETSVFQEDLFNHLNAKARKLLDDELAFFKENKNKESEKVCKEIEKILDKITEESSEDEALIRIGQGAGFNSSTFNLYNKGRNIKINDPKTKVVTDIYPMGWALIRKK